MKKLKNYFTIMAIIAMHVPAAQLFAQRVLSPSTTPQSNEDPITSELNNVDATDRIDPAAVLLITLDNMVPGDLAELGIEESLKIITADFLQGNVQQVVSRLDEVRQQHSELPPTSLLIAGMLFAAGNSQQGVVWLEKAAVETPDYPGIYSGFARIAITQNRITDAAVLLEKANALITSGTWSDASRDQFRSEYLDALTDVAIRRNQLERARSHLLELQKLLPENSKVPLRLAQVEFDLNNVDKSLAYLKTAKALESNLRAPEVILSDWFFSQPAAEGVV